MSVLGIRIIIHYHIKSSIFFSFSIASYGHIALDLKHFSEPNRCLQYCFTTYKESFQFLNSAALDQTKDPIPYTFLYNGAMIRKWSMLGSYMYMYNQHIITFLRSVYFLNSVSNLLYSLFITSRFLTMCCSMFISVTTYSAIKFPTTKHDRMSFPILFCISYQ